MNMSVHKCVHCGEDVDDGNNRTCKKNCTEIKLFGVQIGVSSEDGHGAAAKSLSIRKSKSLDNIVQSCNPAAAAAESSGYLIRKSKSLNDVQSCNPDYTAAAESSGYLSDSKSHERKRGLAYADYVFPNLYFISSQFLLFLLLKFIIRKPKKETLNQWRKPSRQKHSLHSTSSIP